MATAVFVLRTFDKDARLRVREQQQIQIIQLLESSSQDMRMQQLAIRDYRIQRSPEARERLQLHRNQRDEGLNKAKQLAADDRVADMDDALRAARAWDAGIAQLMQDEAVAGNEATRTQVGRAYLERNKIHADAVLDELDALYLSEVGRFMLARSDMDGRIGTARWLTLGMLCVSLLLILAGLWMVSRLVATPIRRLSSQMSGLAEGRLDIVVRDLGRKDEVGGIAKALEVFRVQAIHSHDHNWVKRSTGEVLAALQSTDSPSAFGETLVSEIAPRMKAPLGVFFQWDAQTERLQIAGSTAFSIASTWGWNAPWAKA